MTCVVGIITDDGIYMGADSALSSNVYRTSKQPKIFEKDNMLIGFSGYPRTAQLVQYSLQTPVFRETEQSLFSYMAIDFVDALRACFKTAGHATVINNEEAVESCLLVGYKGRIFRFDSNYQVIECADDYTAIGSGEEVALGALSATVGEPPKQRLEKALLSAEKFSYGVRGPFTFLELNK